MINEMEDLAEQYKALQAQKRMRNKRFIIFWVEPQLPLVLPVSNGYVASVKHLLAVRTIHKSVKRMIESPVFNLNFLRRR